MIMRKIYCIILNAGTSRKILLAIIEGKNPTKTDIVEKVGISYASLHRHIELLLKFKIIKVATDGYSNDCLAGDRLTSFLHYLEIIIPILG